MSERRPAEGAGASSELEERSRALFDDSVNRLDGRTRSRLNQARHAALEEMHKARASRSRWLWAPAGGLAAAVVAVVMLARPSLETSQGAAPLDELEAAAGEESIELLQDVEFYAWLSEQEATPDANSG